MCTFHSLLVSAAFSSSNVGHLYVEYMLAFQCTREPLMIHYRSRQLFLEDIVSQAIGQQIWNTYPVVLPSELEMYQQSQQFNWKSFSCVVSVHILFHLTVTCHIIHAAGDAPYVSWNELQAQTSELQSSCNWTAVWAECWIFAWTCLPCEFSPLLVLSPGLNFSSAALYNLSLSLANARYTMSQSYSFHIGSHQAAENSKWTFIIRLKRAATSQYQHRFIL